MTEAASRLAAVHERIGRACQAARRSPAEVTLVAVSKGRPAEEVEALLAAGHRDFGESRVQEAAEKWPALLKRYPDVRLHMIGRLQSNKAEDALRLFDTIHSLDRASLLEALSAASAKLGRRPRCFVQVNIGEEEQKGGVGIADIGALVEAVRASPLELAGLMAIPPNGPEASPFFAFLNELARRHDVIGLSMGMSGDYPEAVMLGATMVRVGTALFEH